MNLYALILLLFFCFLIVGFSREDMFFKMAAGFMSCLLAIQVWQYGFPAFANTFITNGVAIILAGIGFYMILRPPLDEILGKGD